MKGNKKLLIYAAIGLILLLLVGGLYSYFGVLAPLHQEIAYVDTEIQQQKSFLQQTETTQEEVATSSENTFKLQEEVPVKPLVDQLILQFEKAEVLSDSLIMTMDFSDGEATKDEDETEEAATETAEEQPETAEANVSNEDDSVETENAPAPAPEVLPEGVKKITAEMSVVSKNYEGLLKFLRTIEELKRITVIEAITFTGLDELEMASAEATPDQLKYEITISAYYLPELTDYLKDLPQVEFPAPQGKENPLTGGDEEE
jgi:type IV pilus assembly protein PilO